MTPEQSHRTALARLNAKLAQAPPCPQARSVRAFDWRWVAIRAAAGLALGLTLPAFWALCGAVVIQPALFFVDRCLGVKGMFR